MFQNYPFEDVVRVGVNKNSFYTEGYFKYAPPTHINTNRINPRCDLSAKMKQYLSVILQGEPNCSVRKSRCAPSSFAYILQNMHIQGSHLPICGTTATQCTFE